MSDDDLIPFTKLLDGVCALLTRGQYRPNDTSTEIFFNALYAYLLDAVRSAFVQHVKASKFSPTPADLFGYLETADGRLGAEEAWALALTSHDEFASVVWTAEIAQAWDIARHVMPDEVGARMAFKEAYARLVATAREQRVPVRWQAALGFGLEGRAEAVQKALALGRHVPGADRLLAYASPHVAVALLEGPDGAAAVGLSAVGRAAIQKIRGSMAARRQREADLGLEERRHTSELRAAAAAKVATFAAANGIPMTTPPTTEDAK